MQTITIDIINNKAVRLLEDLELLQLIRVHKEIKQENKTGNSWALKYKGAMSKESKIDIDNQLNELRNAWQ